MGNSAPILQDWYRLYYLLETDEDDFAVSLLALVKYDDKRHAYVAQHFGGTYRQTKDEIGDQPYGCKKEFGTHTESLYALGHWNRLCSTMEEEVIGFHPADVIAWEKESLPAPVFKDRNQSMPWSFYEAWSHLKFNAPEMFGKPVIIIHGSGSNVIGISKNSENPAVTPERVFSSFFWGLSPLSNYNLRIVRTKPSSRRSDDGEILALMVLSNKTVAANVRYDPLFRSIVESHPDKKIELRPILLEDLDIEFIRKMRCVAACRLRSIEPRDLYANWDFKIPPLVPYNLELALLVSDEVAQACKEVYHDMSSPEWSHPIILPIRESEDISPEDSVEWIAFSDFFTLLSMELGDIVLD